MKRLLLLLLVPLAGCLDDPEDQGPIPSGEPACAWTGETTLWLGPDHGLYVAPQQDGATAGNGFAEAFLTNDLDEWTFGPFETPVRVTGNATLAFWTQGNNMPAPIVIGGGPGEGYHFFNQLGTNRGFIESYAIEYASAIGDATIRSYEERFVMPEGGMVLEAGDTLRLLLTNLVLDDAESQGPDILWGETYPSALRLNIECTEARTWALLEEESTPLSIPFHAGLLTGAVPSTAGVNYQDVPFTLGHLTDRLTIRMEQTSTTNPLKDDMDITVLDAAGQQVWSIGSPYSDEIGTRYRENLGTMPPGAYVVRVNSYSGHAYEGRLTITQEAS
ncbi:MAG: hypothetical protein ACPHID_01385 [Thermoplasmatota archaeon]